MTPRVSNISIPCGSFEVQVDGQTPESWRDILAQFKDANVYQTWAYGAVHWGAHNLSHLVVRKEGQLVAAAQLRMVRLPFLRSGLAYLRWGPLVSTNEREAESSSVILAHKMQALKHEYVQRRGLALRVLPNAFSGTARARLFEAAFNQESFRAKPQTIAAYRTVLLDLTPDITILRSQLDQKWRNQLNRAEKNGLSVRCGAGVSEFNIFLKLYHSMWDRKRFETTVDPAEFARMQELLPPEQRLEVLLAERDGVPAAGLVCSCLGSTAIYLLGASNDTGRQLKAAYLLQWHAIGRLKQKGAIRYDLGGIDAVANPGVYHFKTGLSGVEAVHLPPFDCTRAGLSALLVRVAERLRLMRQGRRPPARIGPAVQSPEPLDARRLTPTSVCLL